jgi:hypothetical protein
MLQVLDRQAFTGAMLEKLVWIRWGLLTARRNPDNVLLGRKTSIVTDTVLNTGLLDRVCMWQGSMLRRC